jgi:hypothetical protein
MTALDYEMYFAVIVGVRGDYDERRGGWVVVLRRELR